MAFKAEYIPCLYNFILPTAQLTSLPHNPEYHGKRRKNLLYNKIQRHSLFLNAASLPSENNQELVEIPQTESAPSIDKPAAQLAANLSIQEKSLAEPLDKLDELGAQGFIDHQIAKSDDNKSKNQVSFPESTDPVSSAVLSTNEVKSAVPKRKKKQDLSIFEYESKSKTRRKQK